MPETLAKVIKNAASAGTFVMVLGYRRRVFCARGGGAVTSYRLPVAGSSGRYILPNADSNIGSDILDKTPTTGNTQGVYHDR
jgi:hypothetical protein